MTFLKTAVEVQYYSAFFLQITIAIGMFWRRLYPQARYFFVYIIWQTVSVAILYVIAHTKPPIYYFYGYWINNTITVALGIAIVIEVFNRMFSPYEGIRRMARILFNCSAVLLIVISSILLLYRHAEYSDPILTFVLVTERSVRVIQLGLVLALFAITKYLHLRWRNYLFGIVLDFGFYALMDLAWLAVRMKYGAPVTATVNVLFGTAYCTSVLIWTTYVLQPEAATVPIVSLPSHELERWDRALGQVLGRIT